MTADPGPPAWLDGQVLPRSEARVSIDDFGVRYGAAAFETMFARHGRVFRLDRHLARLEGALALMGVAAPSRAYLAGGIETLLQARDLRDAAVRLTVTAGSGAVPDLGAASAPAVFVTADPLPATQGPARLVVSSVRLDERRPWRQAKVSQFLPYLLARREARAQGADDALMLNYQEEVAESAAANFFLLMDHALVTPALECGPLPGVTRDAVLEVARAERIPVSEASFGLEALMGASAAFLTSSLGIREVVAVQASPGDGAVGVDWAASEPDHPVLRRVRRAYDALVERECAG